jgi:hypothetical protein
MPIGDDYAQLQLSKKSHYSEEKVGFWQRFHLVTVFIKGTEKAY